MTAGNKRNRHSGLSRFLQNSQLLVRRIPTTTLDTSKHFDSISITGHSRMPRLTPSSYLCSYVRFKWGPLQVDHHAFAHMSHNDTSLGWHLTTNRQERSVRILPIAPHFAFFVALKK